MQNLLRQVPGFVLYLNHATEGNLLQLKCKITINDNDRIDYFIKKRTTSTKCQREGLILENNYVQPTCGPSRYKSIILYQ